KLILSPFWRCLSVTFIRISFEEVINFCSLYNRLPANLGGLQFAILNKAVDRPPACAQEHAHFVDAEKFLLVHNRVIGALLILLLDGLSNLVFTDALLISPLCAGV